MARYIDTTTGDPTAKFGFRGTDLGYFTKTNHGYCLATFGDTFDNAMPGGPGWRSPVILRQHNADLDNGIKWDNAVGGARAKEAIPYTHHSKEIANTRLYAPFTIIPNDIVHLPNNTYLMSTHVVRSWERSGPHSWLSWGNKFFVSTERHAEHWTPANFADLHGGRAPMQFDNVHTQHWRLYQNATMLVIGDYLYMLGTESGRTDGGGIYLARVKWAEWNYLFKWEFWGRKDGVWQWGTHAPTAIITPTLPGKPIGEINAQLIDGVVVLAYVDYGVGFVTRTAVHPAGQWTAPQLHATQLTVPNLYAPSVHPYSTLDKAYAHISQWTNTFYGCKFYRLSPLRDPRKEGIGAGTAEGERGRLSPSMSGMTARELAELLTSDTAVSAAELARELGKRILR